MAVLMQIYWYGHSCFKLQGKDVSVVLDPYRPGSVPGWKLPPLTADYCLCSHDHGDHSGKGGVALSGRRPALRLEQFSVFHDARQGRDRGKNLISVLTIDGVRIVHLGDLGHALSADLLESLQWPDVLLIPVGGYYTIDGETAYQIKQQLNPRITVPMHYRVGSRGYKEISTLEPFLAKCQDVLYWENSFFDPEEILSPCTLIPAVPEF